MVSLYVHGHKSLQIDAWLMDLISCKFPICFTLLQDVVEEKMQYREFLTEKNGKPLLELRYVKLEWTMVAGDHSSLTTLFTSFN